MVKLLERVELFRSNILFYFLMVLQVIMLITYYSVTKNVGQPDNIKEAFSLLFRDGESFVLVAVVGTLSWIIWCVEVLGTIVTIPIIEKSIKRYDYNIENRVIVYSKIIITIILLISNIILLKCLSAILGALLIGVAVTFALINWSN